MGAIGSPGRLVSPVLVGRTGQLDLLTRAVVDPPALVLLTGEAGVGKTRLVQELCVRLADGPPVLVGLCHPMREPFPYGPIVEAIAGGSVALPDVDQLNPLAGAARACLPELAHRLPAAPPPIDDPLGARHRVFRAMRELLSAYGPAVLVVEDAHWMDPSTLELLSFLAADPPRTLAIMLTYRPSDVVPTLGPASLAARFSHRAGLTELGVDPLGIPEVRQLIGTILNTSDVSVPFARQLHERTAGLPFAIEELLRLLPDRSDVVSTDERTARRVLDGVSVTGCLRGWLMARVRHLGEDATRVAEAAAVFDLAVSEDLLYDVAGFDPEQGAAATSALLSQDVLRQQCDGRYGFRHELARKAVYHSVPPPQLRLLHARAVDSLAKLRPRPHAQLAHHSRLAGDAAWWRHAETAADLASRRGEEANAADHLRGALDEARLTPSARTRLALKLGRTAQPGLSHNDTVTVLRRVLADEDIPSPARGQIRLNLGILLLNQLGQTTRARAELARAVPELRDHPALAARAMAALAMPVWGREHIYAHLRWMEQASAAVRLVDDPALQTAVLVNRASTLLWTGDPTAWSVIGEWPEAGRSFTETQHLARGACNLADAASWLGYHARADRFAAMAQELAGQCEADYVRRTAEVIALRLDWYAGRWETLADRARQMRQDTADMPAVCAESRLVLGLLSLAHGDLAGAAEDLRAAGHNNNHDGAVPQFAAAAAGLVMVLRRQGEEHHAIETAAAAIDWVRTKGIWVWAAEIAPPTVAALLATGAVEPATRLIEEFADGVRGQDSPCASAALAMCRGSLAEAKGHLRSAAALYARAARGYAALPQPYALAGALAAAGRCRLVSDAVSGARILSTAAARFADLDAPADAAQCRSILREHGISVPHRRGRRGYGNALSPREADVIRLAAGGQTNREIATALFLSQRTVEDHVSHAMRKLGITDRRLLKYPSS